MSSAMKRDVPPMKLARPGSIAFVNSPRPIYWQPSSSSTSARTRCGSIFSAWYTTLRWLLALDLEATKRVLIDILRRWYDEVFRQQEPQILPVLERDGEAKRALQVSMPAEQLIEAATGWEYVREPGIRRVVLIPSYVLRPWSTSGERADTRI